MSDVWKDRVLAWVITVSGPVTNSTTGDFRMITWTPITEWNGGENFDSIEVEEDDAVYVIPCSTPTWAVLCPGIRAGDYLGFTSIPPADLTETEIDWNEKAREYQERHKDK